MRRFFLPLLTIGFLAACAHAPNTAPISGVIAFNRGSYNRLIKKNTGHVNRYSGFYQTFQADVTMLSTYVQTEQLKQNAHFLDWDEKTFEAQHDKMLQEAGAFSTFFMRFYTPDNDYDDFSHGKSIWKVYLEYNGHRFEGTVKAVDKKLVVLQTLYPYFDRFSSAYLIKFNLPMTTVQDGTCKVILTSTLGSAEFSFPTGH